ncbi:MAG: AAA family ATPase [Elusimicrobiaceae bacterium]|jgi:general secretion pathway protein A
MYREYWHLKEKPFENVLDFRYLYLTPFHEECLARLSYAVTEKKSGAVLIGTAGTGKSLLRELLVRKIKEEHSGKLRVFCIVHPMLTITELIRDCFFQLGVEDLPSGKSELLHKFGNTVLEMSEKGEDTVLLIDDAHMLSLETLKELKLLLNLHDYSQRHLLTMILIGEANPSDPEETLMFRLSQVPSLCQRLRVVVQMTQLSRLEVGQYIQHRLQVSGSGSTVFTAEAVDEIYKFSKGNLREINNICDIALLIGYSEKLACIDGDLVKRVVDDINNQFNPEAH